MCVILLEFWEYPALIHFKMGFGSHPVLPPTPYPSLSPLPKKENLLEVKGSVLIKREVEIALGTQLYI